MAEVTKSPRDESRKEGQSILYKVSSGSREWGTLYLDGTDPRASTHGLGGKPKNRTTELDTNIVEVGVSGIRTR